ncbi:sugar phosphate isomerase/epimerase and 4-hydroxyphenylpyruvate domain-containing protein [Alteromonas aestuariivivens]|uniref:Sugar phosphate isomerase/epimerase and 4-hydroxyphenylpyruvate domain-containing protein n=1 Tax=Alteromonas aestuariivivens TaxID=1938339 RepID=A0A3D8M9W7_9ALTE|nr:sugar phosphate isomerase/epimerase and 4-hydroxyphenylpyruvate domain-containing protein [Alteromonas aestuariivivens]RDV26776.1 sugar phosphate isomerase/epimerase and 4-hydroxyphenylpyruvate domain-containing protein [Alteromonas aestuariivivens]
MKRSIATVSLSEDLESKLAAIANAGFEGVEIFENDLLLANHSPKQVGDLIRSLNLTVTSLQPFRDFEAMPPAFRSKNIERAQRRFEVMSDLGTDTLMICSNVSDHTINDPMRAAEDLALLADLAAQYGFKLGYEALSWGRYVNDYLAAWEIVKLADRHNLGIVLDTFHIMARKTPIEPIRSIPKHKITLVQLADAPWMQLDLLQWSRHFRCFPGQGEFPLNPFFDALQATGYDGYVSLEIFNDELRNAPCDSVALDASRSLLWLDEQRYRENPQSPSLWNDPLRGIMPPANVEQIGFMELALSQQHGEFIKLLKSIGFQHIYQHKNKEVQIYQLNDVYFVVNREPDSFAQAGTLNTSVDSCAIGYFCRDVEDMSDRARQLGFVPYKSNGAAGELPFPAFRNNSGKLMYFSTPDNFIRILNSQFDTLPAETMHSPKAMPITRLDHVADFVPFNEFLSSAMMYRTLLGFELDPVQDVFDVQGALLSRTAHSQDRKVRQNIIVNKASVGVPPFYAYGQKQAGLQHMAFACTDIFQMLQALPHNVILPIPEEYYQSIQHKNLVEDSVLDRMMFFSVLVDSSDDGLFFHAFTKQVDGVYFEFVQRVNYEDYGENNSAIRSKAQVVSSL